MMRKRVLVALGVTTPPRGLLRTWQRISAYC
jgi:hypothetical protein